MKLRLRGLTRSPARSAAGSAEYADGRPCARFAFRFDIAAVQLRDVFHDRKAEPGSAEFADARFVGPIKTLENSRQIARRNSDALIRNTDAH